MRRRTSVSLVGNICGRSRSISRGRQNSGHQKGVGVRAPLDQERGASSRGGAWRARSSEGDRARTNRSRCGDRATTDVRCGSGSAGPQVDEGLAGGIRRHAQRQRGAREGVGARRSPSRWRSATAASDRGAEPDVYERSRDRARKAIVCSARVGRSPENARQNWAAALDDGAEENSEKSADTQPVESIRANLPCTFSTHLALLFERPAECLHRRTRRHLRRRLDLHLPQRPADVDRPIYRRAQRSESDQRHRT